MCLAGQSIKTPVKILRDTGATQTLILENVLPFSSLSSCGDSVLLQGIELGTVRVPLHRVELSSKLVSGLVVVGVRPSLPVEGIQLVLGNDLAGGKVEANPCVSGIPCSSGSNAVEAIPGLLSACTRAMAKRAMNHVQDDTDEMVEEEQIEPAEVTSLAPLSSSLETAPATLSESIQQRDELEPTGDLVLSTSRLAKKQKDDPELQKLREQAVSEVESHKVAGCYYLLNDVLIRKWRPRDVPSSEAWRVVHQVVIPQVYRREVLRLAHETPLAGHLGINKTYRKILNHFYWPGRGRM